MEIIEIFEKFNNEIFKTREQLFKYIYRSQNQVVLEVILNGKHGTL